MKIELIATLTLGALLVSGKAFADDLFSSADPTINHPHSDPANNSQTMASQRFVTKAGLDDAEQISLGRLALQKSHNRAVRRFARRMIHDHGKANHQLIGIARTEGLKVPPPNSFSATKTYPSTQGWANSRTVSSTTNVSAKQGTQMTLPPGAESNPQVQEVDRLKSLPEPEFDRAYANAMVKDHQKAIAFFNNASHNVQDPKLQRFAKKTLSALHKHYQMAQKLQGQVNGQNHNGSQ